MSGFGIFGFLASIFQLIVPSYALRLVRRFGSSRVGWFVAAAFASLALLHLLGSFRSGSGMSASSGRLDGIYLIGSVLLLIGMGHLETLFSERAQAGSHERRLRAKWEQELEEKTCDLAQANQQLLEGISRCEQQIKVLTQTEAQYRSLFIENPQAMWIFDLRSLRFLAVNNAALRQYGFTPQEFMSLSPRDLLSPETLPAFLQDAPKPCAGVESHGLWQHRRKDGTIFNAEITALDLRYGEIPARLVLVRDVTQRWLRDQQSLATRKMELIRQMAGGFAHHFNNILTIIDGHANLLLRKPQDQGNTEQLTKISTAANRAAALTRQFVAVGGRQALRLEPVSLNTELQTLAPTLKRLLGDRVGLQTSFGPGLPLILGDPRSVEHVVLNLVLNARAAVAHNGAVSIATSGVRIDEARAQKHPQARPGPFVRLTVRDNGCGMTPEVQAHLFEPFFTTHDVGGGTGLGLASIYGVVSQHSGWIEYSTELGSGTEFNIFFPCAPASATTVEGVPLAVAAVPAPKTILIVEASERARTLARFILARHGYRVVEADSPATVMILWKSQAKQIDLVVTELNGSGDLSARAFADELRKTRPDLRVLFTLAPAPDAEQSTPGRLGGQNFVPKPFTAGNLLPAVEACLSAKASARC